MVVGLTSFGSMRKSLDRDKLRIRTALTGGLRAQSLIVILSGRVK